VPRIDRKVIQQYKEDIIVLSGNLNGEIRIDFESWVKTKQKKSLLWWKEDRKTYIGSDASQSRG
jgi:DNA polymerase-3 subunit alpha